MKTRDQEIKELSKRVRDISPLLLGSFISHAIAAMIFDDGYRKTDPSYPCETIVDYVGKCPICGHFGHIKYEKPIVVPSVEDLINVILEVDKKIPKGKKLVIEYATAIHAMLSKANESGISKPQ